MRLSDLLNESRVSTSLKATSKDEALAVLASLLATCRDTPDPNSIVRVLRDRESLASTGVGDEVAIPHGRLPGITRVVAALALAPDGVDFDSIDGKPVKIFVAILAPERCPGDQLRALARVSKLLRDRRVRGRLVECASVADVMAVVADEETALP